MTVTAAVFTLALKILAGCAILALVIFIALLFDGSDRVLNARMQRRVGPPLFQPILDIFKLMSKENIVPRRAVRFFFMGAPWVALVSTLMIFLYIPLRPFPAVLGTEGDMILILYLLILGGVAMAVGGFASGSPIASIGANRKLTLMVSYEFPLAVVIATMAWVAFQAEKPGVPFSMETFTTTSIWFSVGKIGLFGVACLFLSLIMVIPGETAKGPMDIPEAKTEILDGLIIEYSGVNLAMLKLTFALRALAISVFVTSRFVPWSLVGILGTGGVVVAFFDFFFFWTKVFIVQVIFVTVMRTAFGRLKIWQASSFYLINATGLALIGMLLLSIDAMISSRLLG